MRTICIFVVLVCVSPLMSRAQTAPQTAVDSVKAVVNALFTGMKTGDSALLRSCFDDDAILQTIARNKEGKTIVRQDKVADFAAQVVKLPKGAADERIQFETVKIDGAMAIAWTPYQFYYNGQYSHQGVNMFQLVNYDGTWKIHFLIDTRRK